MPPPPTRIPLGAQRSPLPISDSGFRSQTQVSSSLPLSAQRSLLLANISTHCGRPLAALRAIQKTFALHIPADGVYSDAYCRFLEKIVALLALHVSRAALLEIFEKEKQILRLLHVDTLTSSPTWYLDDCVQPETKAALTTRLLLSGYDLGFQLDAPATQDTLDFGSREKNSSRAPRWGRTSENSLRIISAFL